MGVGQVSVVFLVWTLSYSSMYITEAVPTCTNYRPIRIYGNWCFKYPLHWAAQAGHMEEVTALIRDGKDVDQQTHPGRWAPLHFAANYGRANVVNLLLKHGASALVVDRMNQNPKNRAQAKYCKGYRTNASCGLSNFNYYRSIMLLENAMAKEKKKLLKNRQGNP
ncbi:unnamed protein product, partial [Meganyctiphanes norvegica]